MTDSGSEEFDPHDFLMSFREIAVGVLMSPRAFFKECAPPRPRWYASRNGRFRRYSS
jgi:hypothetical protein